MNRILNKNSRILITGCGGMLGKAVYEHFSPKYNVWATDIDLNEPWLKFLDVKDLALYEEQVKQIKPDYIFHLAATTSLEDCETNQKQAYENNFLGVRNGATIAKKYNAKFIFTSSAGVFNGLQKEYRENDQPKPINVYGQTKYLGELEVKLLLDDYIIIRPGWMIGGGLAKDKKFVSEIIKKIQSGETELQIVNDKYGAITFTENFAKNLDLLLASDLNGIWHMVNQGSCNRLELAREIVKQLGYNKIIKITGVNSDYFQKRYFAPRPAYEILINQKLIDHNLLIMEHWKVALKQYLKKDYSQYYCKVNSLDQFFNVLLKTQGILKHYFKTLL